MGVTARVLSRICMAIGSGFVRAAGPWFRAGHALNPDGPPQMSPESAKRLLAAILQRIASDPEKGPLS